MNIAERISRWGALRFFADTSSERRRLVLHLYALVGPLFIASMLILGPGWKNPWPLVAVVALVASGAAWLLLRRTPTVHDWLFPVAIAPTVSCGIGSVACGGLGAIYLVVVGAPLAWAAVLFEAPVVGTALVASIVTVFTALSLQVGAAAAAVSTVLMSPIAVLVAWVVFTTANQLRATRQRLAEIADRDRALIEAIPDTLVRADRSGHFLDVHSPAGDALPAPKEALIGRSVAEFVPPDVARQMQAAIDRAIATGDVQTVRYEARYGGATRSFESRFAPSVREEVIVIRRDVTRERDAEDTLRRVLREQQLILENASVGISLVRDRKLVWVSPRMAQIFGYSPEELAGRSTLELYPSREAYQRLGRDAYPVMVTGRDFIAEGEMKRRDGSVFWARAQGKAIDPSNVSEGSIWIFEDISSRKDMEVRLRESEERFRTVVDASGEGIVKRNRDGTISVLNPAAERLLGVTAAQLEGRAPTDPAWHTLREDGSALTPDERPSRMALRTGVPQPKSVVGVHKPDGTVTWLSANAQPLWRSPGEPPYAVVTIFTDITEQRRQAVEIERQRQQLALAMEGSHLGYWDWDLETDRTTYSPLWPALLGYGPDEIEPTYRSWAKLVHSDDVARVNAEVVAHVKGVASLDTQYRMRAKDGSWRWIHSRGKVIERNAAGRATRITGTHAEVTWQREAQDRLARAERLASVTTLVKGMTHEVNNPLASLIANVSYAHDQLQAAMADGPVAAERREWLEDLAQALGDASESGRRVSSIVSELRSFTAVGEPPPPARGPLRKAVDEALGFARRGLSSCAEVVVDVPPTMSVEMSHPALVQVLMHLLMNAGQATGSRPNTVRVAAEALSSTRARITVSDTGVGMGADEIAHAFEPFYSARGVGRSRGLGLSVCLGIVQTAGGQIELQSKGVGLGTTVTVVLPLAKARPPAS